MLENAIKHNDTLELCISVTSSCNMHCEFCFENNHLKQHKVFSLPSDMMYQKIIDKVNKKLRDRTYQKVELTFWGGELFYDDVPDKIFECYITFVRTLQGLISLPLSVVSLSNGIYTKHERIVKLMQQLNGKIALSYDPVGRFPNVSTFDTFCHTAEVFQRNNILQGYSIALTKPTIDAYITRDQFLVSVDKSLPIFVNFYIPNSAWKKYMPTDDDYYNFLTWCLHNNMYNVDWFQDIMLGASSVSKEWVQHICRCGDCIVCNIEQERFTQDNCIIVNDSEQYYDNVTELSYEQRTFYTAQKLGCFSCEFFDSCTRMCNNSVLFNRFQPTQCPIQKFYDVVTEHDTSTFLKWYKEKKDDIIRQH